MTTTRDGASRFEALFAALDEKNNLSINEVIIPDADA